MAIKLIPFTDNLCIDDDGNFYLETSDQHLNPVFPKKVFTQNGALVTLNFANKIRTIGVGWLKCLAMTEYNLDINPLNVIENFTQCRYLDRDWYIPTFIEPIYIDRAKNFRIVPGFYSIAINRQGIIIDTKTTITINNDPIKTKTNKVIVYDPLNSKNSKIPISFLVALAWLPNEYPSILTEIKHRDGDCYNCNCSNLEWSYSDDDASKMISEFVGTEFRVRDVYTGEIIGFSDVESTLKFLNLPNTLTYKNMLYNGRLNQLFNKKYEVRSSADVRPWFYVDGRTPENTSSTSKFLFSIKDKNTSKESFIAGGRALAEKYNISDSHMSTEKMMDIIRIEHPNLNIELVEHVSNKKPSNVVEYSF